MATPIRPDSHETSRNAGKRVASAWDVALAAFDETIEIPEFGARFANSAPPYGTPAVTYKRTNKLNFPSAVWVKLYLENKTYNLKPFAKYEVEILNLVSVKAAHQHISRFLKAGSGSTDLYEFSAPDTSGYQEITTESKGASVSYWASWPLRTAGRNSACLKHLFLPAGNYLRFAKAALIALDKLHSCGNLVHCDLHQGNWCMKPANSHPHLQGDQRIYLEIDWDKLAIIDLGFALHPAKAPPLLIPIDERSASPHLNKATKHARKLGEADLNEASEVEWKKWTSFDAAALDLNFWQNHAPKALSTAYEKVDWREDYWKLGQMLWQLRGGQAVSDHLEAENKRLGTHSPTDAPEIHYSAGGNMRVVNRLIGQCESFDKDPETRKMIRTSPYGLAEDLIAWGTIETEYDTNTQLTSTQRRNAANKLRQTTHAALMQRLNEAIEALEPEDTVTKVFLYRKDIDKAYADQEAGEKAWQSHVQQSTEEQRIKDQAKQDKLDAEREAQRLAVEADEARLRQVSEDEQRARDEAEQARQRQLEWEREQEKKAEHEAEQTRLLEEKRLADEAEEARLRQVAEDEQRARDEAEQAHQHQLAAELESQRRADEVAEARLRKEAEEKRLAAQAQLDQLEWEKDQAKKAAEKEAHEAEQARLLEAKRLAEQARLLEAKRLADEARRERNALWLAKARTTIADVAPKAAAGAVVMGAMFAWIHWGEPVWRDQAKPTLISWYGKTTERAKSIASGVVTFDSTGVRITPAEPATTKNAAAIDAAKNAAQAAQRPGQPANLKAGATFTDSGGGIIAPVMVVIPPTGPGGFMMGSPASEKGDGDEKQHRVTLSQPFALSQKEVTWAQWEMCTSAGGCAVAGEDKPTPQWGTGQQPLIRVSWNQAQAYAQWLNTKLGFASTDPYRYRLPSEAEWEYAARGGNTGPYGFVDANKKPLDISANLANYESNYQGGKTREVGSYPPNAFGLYDMHGNVWEWVADCSEADYDKLPDAVKSKGAAHRENDATCPYRVLRGGSWSTTRRTCVRPTATGTRRRIATTSLVSVSPGCCQQAANTLSPLHPYPLQAAGSMGRQLGAGGEAPGGIFFGCSVNLPYEHTNIRHPSFHRAPSRCGRV